MMDIVTNTAYMDDYIHQVPIKSGKFWNGVSAYLDSVVGECGEVWEWLPISDKETIIIGFKDQGQAVMFALTFTN